jgi:REP element-mobilizing transposase RayT
MQWPERKRLDHVTPEWVGPEAKFFVTVCAKPRGRNHFCREGIGQVILDSIRYRNDRETWFCHLAVLMPDHIHMLLSFAPEVVSFTKIVGSWKHWLGHQHGVDWQENFFDHRIRAEEKYSEKVQYVWDNPVRAGLVGNMQDWPWKFMA